MKCWCFAGFKPPRNNQNESCKSIPVVGVVFFSQSLPEVCSGQTQKNVFFPSMHAAPFKHLFGEQLFGSSSGLVGGASVK